MVVTDLLGLRLGMGGPHSPVMGKDEWLTPPHILKALGRFGLDPCAPVIRPWEIADKHYTVEDNGLIQSWGSARAFMNPPYGGPKIVGPWMHRMAEHNHGVVLIFARTETDLFFETVWTKATALLFIRGRLHFHHANGKRADHNAGAPSVLIAYGGDDAGILESCDIDGKFIALK